jgi:hypothetical protein
MRRSAQQSTAFERARVAYELMTQRKRAAERRMRERSRRTTIVTVMVGMLCLLIGSSIYNGWFPLSWQSSGLTARVEDDTFARTRTGQVRSFVKGDTCRDLQFSNDRGAYVGGSLVPCESIIEREPSPGPSKIDRLNAIRGAFTAR